MDEMETTQIQVKVTTRNKLKEILITARESYDEVINRLIDEHKRRGR